jgi:putative membrane protein
LIQLIVRLIINMIALAIAAAIVPGVQFSGGDGAAPIGSIVLVALIFGLVNAVIKPVLAFITCPFYVLTLGLFTFVINALMLMLTSWLVGPRFVVEGFWPALLGSIVISLVSTLLSIFVDGSRANNRKSGYIGMRK